jgi:hypothetical protein
MMGYNKIPADWKAGLEGAEDIDFKYTTISLNEVYEIGYRHAIENIKRNGGAVKGENITIPTQKPKAVRFEQSFPGLYPVAKEKLTFENGKDISFEFEGIGFILSGDARAKINNSPSYEFKTEVYLDGKMLESPTLPTDFTTRRLEVSWKYPLPKGKHRVSVKILNPDDRYDIRNLEYIVLSDQPAKQSLLEPKTPF